MSKQPLSIDKEFVVMSPEKNASIEHPDSEPYARLDENYNHFVGHELISCYEFTSDWSSWEMHPHGDEVVILMSGRATFVLETAQGEKSIELSEPGQYVIVPKGTWHTAKTPGSAKMLFVTPGQGTEHRNM